MEKTDWGPNSAADGKITRKFFQGHLNPEPPTPSYFLIKTHTRSYTEKIKKFLNEKVWSTTLNYNLNLIIKNSKTRAIRIKRNFLKVFSFFCHLK